VIGRYREEWAKLGRDAADLPLMGLSRHIVVAETDAEALAIARPAYARWRSSLRHLWLENGHTETPGVILPPTFDEHQASGAGFAGSPGAVRDYIAQQLDVSGASYFVSALSFGDMAFCDAMRSVELYSRDVMPAFV
jgi:alkanesulfonate monooxygenase SsuD/methylene tetrahydromethanopterin reductase-like flavin-dependent oxidoreductase (luciferase family)